MFKFLELLAQFAELTKITADQKAEIESAFNEMAESDRTEEIKTSFNEIVAKFSEGSEEGSEAQKTAEEIAAEQAAADAAAAAKTAEGEQGA
jgi:myo-inositol-1-phosphate synthase